MFNLFKKKKEEVKKPTYLPLKVREVVKETADTVSIYFEQPEPYLDYKPGQFLTLVIDFEGKEQRRSYSLCTSPYVDPFPGISVKRVPGGLFSNFLNEKIHPGKTINVLKPLGNFTTDFHSKNQKHFFLIAGGSGITPMMGILKSVLANEPKSKVTLLYASRHEEHIIFKKELAELEAKHEGKLKVIHNLSQPTDSWTGLKGRLSLEKLAEFIKGAESEGEFESEYFICGPEGILENSLVVLEQLGVNKDRIHKESFYSAAAEAAHEANASNTGLTRDVKILMEGEEYMISVSPDKTILEAGLNQDLNMPYSCQSGLCTACRGKLISGQVKMDEDDGLSEKEINEGYVLCCVGRPLTDDVQISIE